MKAEVKQAWLEALRSGEYKQGQDWLRDGDQFCCLGVLCDLYIRAHAADSEWRLRRVGPLFSVEGEVKLPPESVIDWAGLVERDPYVRIEGGPVEGCALAYLNDDLGMTFAEIADIIEHAL